MKTYVIENAFGMIRNTMDSTSVLDVLQHAETLHPQDSPTGWMKATRQGKAPYHRWTQFKSVNMMLERTGVTVDCFDTRPALEDFQPPGA